VIRVGEGRLDLCLLGRPLLIQNIDWIEGKELKTGCKFE